MDNMWLSIKSCVFLCVRLSMCPMKIDREYIWEEYWSYNLKTGGCPLRVVFVSVYGCPCVQLEWIHNLFQKNIDVRFGQLVIVHQNLCSSVCLFVQISNYNKYTINLRRILRLKLDNWGLSIKSCVRLCVQLFMCTKKISTK